MSFLHLLEQISNLLILILLYPFYFLFLYFLKEKEKLFLKYILYIKYILKIISLFLLKNIKIKNKMDKGELELKDLKFVPKDVGKTFSS